MTPVHGPQARARLREALAHATDAMTAAADAAAARDRAIRALDTLGGPVPVIVRMLRAGDPTSAKHAIQDELTRHMEDAL